MTRMQQLEVAEAAWKAAIMDNQYRHQVVYDAEKALSKAWYILEDESRGKGEEGTIELNRWYHTASQELDLLRRSNNAFFQGLREGYLESVRNITLGK